MKRPARPARGALTLRDDLLRGVARLLEAHGDLAAGEVDHDLHLLALAADKFANPFPLAVEIRGSCKPTGSLVEMQHQAVRTLDSLHRKYFRKYSTTSQREF